jgi:tetratricopeptide (TPR) repeat protein
MTDGASSSSVFSPRHIRVFVSSTFRDMQAERDYLVKFIFPQLRKLSESRGVTWGEVDLRWGVTEEQQAEGKVLPICLAEIQRCRPYFIGLLGERYGWVPEAIPQELIEQEKWLAEHQEHSVTELEILHGVLNNPAMADHSMFYFRDPAYFTTLPPEEQHAFQELPTPEEIVRLGQMAAAQRAEERRGKLAALKARIRLSGLPVRENYPDPQALGQFVLTDFTALIDRLYPEAETPDPLTREAAEHEVFAQSRAKVYIGRQAYFDQLDAHAAGDGPPLVILGESGVGKSALLANWALRYRDAHPDIPVLVHFIGATPYSADWAAMLRRLLGEFKRRGGIDKEIPVKPEDLRAAMDEWLPLVAAAGRIVLILDGLNQLADKDNAPDLLWLPVAIPPNVRIVLSTLPGRSLAALQKRGWSTVTVEPLNEAERQRFIVDYLAQYTKVLAPGPAARLAASPQAGNPLYLQALLEELRVFGDHERLEATITHYLEAATIPELYGRILARYETDYQRDRPGLVRDALTLLWAARRGLSDAELLDLLGTDGAPLPRAVWSPLFLAAESALGRQVGRLTFAHPHIRLAIATRYLPAHQAQEEAHGTLADYFANRGMDDRVLEELPWQLQEAGQAERLHAFLAEIPVFMASVSRDARELWDYWRGLGARFDVARTYRESLARWEVGEEDPASHATVFDRVATFLFETAGRLAEAEPLYRRALAIYEQVLGPMHPHTATSLVNLAALLQATGNFTEAEPLFRRALAIWEKTLGPEHPETMQGRFTLAQLLRDKGEHGESAALYRSILHTAERVLDRSERPATSLLQLMAISHNELAFHTHVPAREWAEAEYHYQRSLEFFEQLGSSIEVANIGLNLQTLYFLAGRPVDLAKVREFTRLLEESGDRRAEKGHKLLKALSGIPDQGEE